MEIEVIVYSLLGVIVIFLLYGALSNPKALISLFFKYKNINLHWNAVSHLRLENGKQVSLLEFNHEISLEEAIIFLKRNLKETVLTKLEIEEAATQLLHVYDSSFFAIENIGESEIVVYYYNFIPLTRKVSSRLAGREEILCKNDDCYFLVPSIL